MDSKEIQKPLMAKNNAAYQTVDGVTYFKLKSEFEGDYTKNCGLLGEEIDKNFYFLRGYDIENITIDEERNLIITRVDKSYQPIIVNVDKKIDYPSFSFNKEKGVITVTYPDGSVTILDGFLIEGKEIRLTVDSSFVGDGTIFNPLKLSPLEKTGTFAPVDEYIDHSIYKDDLPERESGYRILTKELFDSFGCFYPLSTVKLLDEYLKETNSVWRITTKADWDNILNYYECPENRNHGKDTCEWLGETAGRAVKSGQYWLNYEDEPSYGENVSRLSILPLGLIPERNEILDDEDNDAEGFRKLSGIWTSTCTKEGNAYAKIFSYKTGSVKQDTYGQGAKLSIRFIRDWSIDNQHKGVEEIFGYPFTTVEVCGVDGRKYVMTDINLYINDEKKLQSAKSNEWNAVSEGERGAKGVYFINESKGNHEWYKKIMRNGDSVVINKYEDKNYHEWRVVDGTLVDTADYISEVFTPDFILIKDNINNLQDQINDTNGKLNDYYYVLSSFCGSTIESLNKLDTDIVNTNKYIDALSANTNNEIAIISENIAKINDKLTMLEGLIESVEGALESVIKETVKKYVAGTVNEIKVTPEINDNVETLRIGFDDDAIFGAKLPVD